MRRLENICSTTKSWTFQEAWKDILSKELSYCRVELKFQLKELSKQIITQEITIGNFEVIM